MSPYIYVYHGVEATNQAELWIKCFNNNLKVCEKYRHKFGYYGDNQEQCVVCGTIRTPISRRSYPSNAIKQINVRKKTRFRKSKAEDYV